MKIPKFLLAFFFLSLSITAYASPYFLSTIEISQHKLSLDNFIMGFLHDDKNKLAIGDISRSIAFKWTKNQNSFGFNHKITWYKIVIKNLTKIQKNLYLHHNLAYMSKQVDIFEFRGKQQLDQNRYQIMDPNIAQKLQGSTLVYPFTLAPGNSKTIYIKNQGLVHQLLDIAIYEQQDSIRALINKNFFSNIIIATLLALAFYNVLLFFFSKRKEYIYYSLYLMNTGLGLFYMYGSVFHNLAIYGEQVYWFNITAILVSLFMALFVKSIFDITTGRMNRLFNLIIALSFIDLIIAIFIDIALAIKLVNLIFLFSFIVLIYAGLYYFQQKHPLAKIFILAYSVYMIGFSITLLSFVGAISYNYVTFHASGFALVIEALLFSYLLHFRIRLLEQKLVQQKDTLILKNKKTQMGDMIAAITHQWKQPLTAISSIVTFLQYRLDDVRPISSKELAIKLSQINEKTHFLVETIHDFREFFKPDNVYEKTDIKQLINRAVVLSYDDMLAAGIIIKTDLNYSHKIAIYQNELLHIILNLIQNSKEAFKCSQAELKMIKIVGFNRNNQISIDFIDNAGGISMLHLPHIFNEFYTTKEKKEGTGLGLYLSKFILEQHMNGSIEANNVDNGVAFRITIGIEN